MKIEKIHLQIKEYSKIAAYSNLQFSKTASSGGVGIWWFYKEEVIALQELPENLPKEDLLCVEQEHIKAWLFLQKAYESVYPELLDMKFDSIERGRVWFEERTKKYYITCSKELLNNSDAIQKIKIKFGIENKPVIVRRDWQYDM